MRKKLVIAFGVFLVILVAFAIIITMQPKDYTVTRSGTVGKPPSEVFDHVNDFHKWKAWSPWAALDPNCKYEFEGPEKGVGAIYKWKGNDEVGEGIMTILESKPNESIKMKLEFIKPFASVCNTDFTFKAAGEKTDVTWTMSGEKNFMSKAFTMFMSMDKMIGKDFEKGLVNLNTVVTEEKK